MKKEVKFIVDSDKARKGLFINGNFASIYRDSDEQVVEKAVGHVEEFASNFGFELAPEIKPMNTNLEKTVTVKINTHVARQMLELAGFFSINEKSDDEVFEKVMSMILCYGATYEIGDTQ